MTGARDAVPVDQFRERHQRLIAASPEAVWQALLTVRLDDLTLARLLVAVRHGGRPPAGGSRPLLDDGPLAVVEREPLHHALGLAIGRPWQRRAPRRPVSSLAQFLAFDEPGWTKYATDFVLVPVTGGTLLRTETRGYSTDEHARRRFSLYWAGIRPFSGLARRDLLAAVARRAADPRNAPPGRTSQASVTCSGRPA